MNSFELFWHSIRVKHQALIRAGICQLSWAGSGDKKYIIVVCPDRSSVRSTFLREGGKYRKRTHCWHFPFYKWEQVLNLCTMAFGKEAIRIDDRGI